MGRIDEVMESQKKLREKVGLNSAEKRMVYLIGILSEISDSFALFCDIYAKANGIELEKHGGWNDAGKEREVHNSEG